MLRQECDGVSVSLTMLASGSRGNARLVASACTRFWWDAGISCRETFKRMRALGDDPGDLCDSDTHEHSDIFTGWPRWRKNCASRVYDGADAAGMARRCADENGVRPQLEKFERFEADGICGGRY